MSGTGGGSKQACVHIPFTMYSSTQKIAAGVFSSRLLVLRSSMKVYRGGLGMDWYLALNIVTVPVAFVIGRYSARYRFIRIKRRYRQNVGQFIRGR